MRADLDYTKGSAFVGQGIPQDWLDPGFYKIRARSFGHWIPIEIWFEDGDRDPETWELLSDQILRAEWYPRTDSAQAYSVNPRRFFNRAHPIDRREFEWLLTLRKM